MKENHYNLQEVAAINSVIDTILHRRSVRSFLPQNIPPEYLEAIIKSGIYAPSGHNRQLVRLFVMQNPERIDALNRALVDVFSAMSPDPESHLNSMILRARQSGHNFFYHAPVVISAIAPRAHLNSMADSATALQNMQIAAASLKLGACWINQPHWLTDKTPVRKIFEELGMTGDDDIFGSLSVGYPSAPLAEPLPRKAGRVIYDL